MQVRFIKCTGVVILTLGMVISVAAQQILRYQLQGAPDRKGIIGNAITDLLHHRGRLLVGTGYGLSMTEDNGESWISWGPREYGGKGGVSAMAVAEDGTIWIATAYDSTIDGSDLQVGGGLRYLPPGGDRWIFVPQPVDARDDTAGGKQPTTTRVQNVTFDIAILDTQIWIASFGGGIRRSLDGGKTWEVITTDGKPFGALQYLNHRGFSVMAANGSIWVGTAEGISKSTNGGKTWVRFTHQNQGQPISGNWVIALAHNPYDNSVWAATLRAEDPDEFNAISRTRNGGLTWEVYLAEELADGSFPRYIAFYDSVVYVATENGVYKSIDDGQTWYKLPPIVDSVTGEAILTNTYYSVATSPAPPPFHYLWVGSSDGLAMTRDNGFTWTVFRSVVSTRERTDPPVYAYPNPFSPLRHEFVRFQFAITTASTVTIEIYNFAMEKVVTLQALLPAPQEGAFDRSIRWDGRDGNRRMVDNGVYFFRARVGDQVSWGKIVIIN